MRAVEILSGKSPFKEVRKAQMERLGSTFHAISYSEKQQVTRQEEIIREIGILESGSIRLIMQRAGGESLRCGSLHRGDFLFDPGLMTGGRSIFGAYCETSVVCHVQSIRDFWAMIELYPQIKDYFYGLAVIQMKRALEVANAPPSDASYSGDHDISPLLRPRAVRKALVFIEENYMKPLTLDQAARVNGMSKYHFSRIFKQKTGYTFKAFLNKRRIEKAKSLMDRQEMNVSEAAATVGYSDLAYFSRLFQRQEGLSPSRYRKGLRAAGQENNHKST